MYYFLVKTQGDIVYEDVEKEDPTLYVSEKTGRGPLSHDWIDEQWSACKGQDQPTKDGKAIMCAYKLCKVEFRYWGMQSKIERFIHDVALRKTMLKAHSQVNTHHMDGQVCIFKIWSYLPFFLINFGFVDPLFIYG